MAIAQLSPGSHRSFPLTPQGLAGRRPEQTQDAFDHWLDRSLREMFAERPGKPLPPEVKALIEPKQRKAKPPPPKPR